jgi:hypothetical protein
VLQRGLVVPGVQLALAFGQRAQPRIGREQSRAQEQRHHQGGLGSRAFHEAEL